MAPDSHVVPNAKPPASEPEREYIAHSRPVQVLAEAEYLWQSIGAVVLGVVGIGALAVAVAQMSGVALAIALISLPLAAILWLAARGLRDAQREL